MAELGPRERLQPSLLDRLTDRNPEKKVEGRDARVFSMAEIRRSVLRDIAWLLAARAHTRDEDIYDFKYAAKSVINFGIADVSGENASSLRPDEVRRMVVEAIRTYEPRIAANTLAIKVNVDKDRHDNAALWFEIGGELWDQPAPEWLNIETDYNIEHRTQTLSRHIEEEQLHGGPPTAGPGRRAEAEEEGDDG